MDQSIQRVLRFDRFALDLTRGCLRGPERDIDLRPKVFEVLRYLAENAGRLVPKQELIEAVWPNVFVSDDSLAQCIRELREKLGDREHNLIKTVPRRGYLLDATGAAAAPDGLAQISPYAEPDATTGLKGPRAARLVWGLAALLCAAVTVTYMLWLPPAAHTVSQNAGARLAGHSFKDCDICPEMVALPAGEFVMGPSKNERGPNDGLQRRVAIPKPLAIGKFEITVDQFSAFIAETETPVSNQCRIIDPAAQSAEVKRALRAERGEHFESAVVNWSPPEGSFREQRGYTITGSHPAACISWLEAQAYVIWLRRRTGKAYRLPAEAEWEYAARAGTTTRYSYGDDKAELCAYARFADLTSPFEWRSTCRGETTAPGPLPVGKLKPNPWGLFDMHGNVWEWTDDCWKSNPDESLNDGSGAARSAQCEIGTARGGSWASGPGRLRSDFRYGLTASKRDQNVGFRVALPLAE